MKVHTFYHNIGMSLRIKNGIEERCMMQDLLSEQEMKMMTTIMVKTVGINSFLGIRRTGSLTSCRNMKEIGL